MHVEILLDKLGETNLYNFKVKINEIYAIEVTDY